MTDLLDLTEIAEKYEMPELVEECNGTLAKLDVNANDICAKMCTMLTEFPDPVKREKKKTFSLLLDLVRK